MREEPTMMMKVQHGMQQFSCKMSLLWCYTLLALLCFDPWSDAFSLHSHRGTFGISSFPSAFQSSATTTTALHAKTQHLVDERWFPRRIVYDDDIYSEDDATAELETNSLELASTLIQRRLDGDNIIANNLSSDNNKIAELVKERFIDLTCTEEGEHALESLFQDELAHRAKEDVVRGAVMILQSLCVMGTQLGVKGPPEQLRRMVSHLDSREDQAERDLYHWDRESVRRLKYRVNRVPAVQLLAELSWKRTTQGAFDLLVALGAWTKHEDLALLRSGFPLRFTLEEEEAAAAASQLEHDPDEILGLRKDLRHMKVYTIDGPSTAEIDDGLSVERIQKEDGTERRRIWIHIADADRWAPRNSTLFETAKRRITSLYLPSGSIPMFPPLVSTQIMSLKANHDVCALSLSVELNDDGSIDSSTVEITPSLIRVDYRLTYDDVDEMLEEGTGYFEEWELGALLEAAAKRRAYRIRNGSSEGMIPNPVPYASVSIFTDRSAPDDINISVKVEVSHNAGRNRTAESESTESGSLAHAAPVSSSSLLVTEAMILAGEAVGRWKSRFDDEELKSVNGEMIGYPNCLRLPFRTQAKPDFQSRSRENRIMMNLLEYNAGEGLCHAWYSRRFLQPVRVKETSMRHSGLGLDCYVQWTSPIRRYSDLQVHASVKRCLRRKRVYEMIKNGSEIPAGVTPSDLGWPLFSLQPDGRLSGDDLQLNELDQDLDYLEGIGLIGAARTLQRQSQQYWLFEYVRRLKHKDPDVTFKAVVLGCIDPEKQQYAIYVYELGLEHRYTSPGRLHAGAELQLRVDSSIPRNGILTFVRKV